MVDEAASASPFSARTVIVAIAATALAFVAFLLLLAFGGAPRGHDAHAHALSVSGDGFAGLVALIEADGGATLMIRDRNAANPLGLMIATPPAGGDGAALKALIARRDDRPTLIVLPKWQTRPNPNNRAWIEITGLYAPDDVLAPLSKIAPQLRLGQRHVTAPQHLPFARIGAKDAQQRLDSTAIEPLLTDAEGRLVLARLPDSEVYVLADPDLLNNAGLADRKVAAAAMAVIDRISPNNEIAFDLTLNGLGVTHGTLRLLFEPPLLPATVCLAIAGLLAGLHGAVRFGAPIQAARVIAFGKAALLDNTAALVRASRKEARLGSAYAAVALTEAARAAGLPPGAAPEKLAHNLDRTRVARGEPPYHQLAANAAAAGDRAQLVTAARALHRWMKDGMV